MNNAEVPVYKGERSSSSVTNYLLGDTVAESKRVGFDQESLPPVLYLPVERVRVCLKIVATCLSKDMRSKYN